MGDRAATANAGQPDEAEPHGVWHVIRDNSLSIALFTLFAVCISAQAATGFRAYAQSLAQAHLPSVRFGAYLRTGTFLDGVFSNWQAAVLQLAVLVAFSAVLRQKGAAHSLKPDGELKTPNRRALQWKITPRDTLGEWLYANSLSLAFLAMFLITFGLHLLFGTWGYNEEQALRHLGGVSVLSFAGSSSFWFTVFQTWEAEFAVIGLYIVLSIFLRQENSSESKAVEATNEQTGDANE